MLTSPSLFYRSSMNSSTPVSACFKMLPSVFSFRILLP